MGNPSLLRCDYIRPDLQKLTNAAGWLRQVKSREAIVGIVTNSVSSYSLKYYYPTNLAGTTNGLYALVGSPYQTFTIELVNGDTNVVRLTESLNGAITDYIWATNGWTLVSPNSLRFETKLASVASGIRTESTTIKNSATGPLARLNPFRASTKYQDGETDLLYYGYRYLSTVTGTWINRDPIGESGGFNLYSFAENNSVANLDLLGLDTKQCTRTLIMGHFVNDGLPALSSFIASSPGKGCDAGKIAFLTCASDYLLSQVEPHNRLPLPPEIAGTDLSEKVPKKDIERANKKKKEFPNLANRPPITQKNAHYADSSATTMMEAFNYLVEQTKKECKEKSTCCSTI